jgi:hypothetical protein
MLTLLQYPVKLKAWAADATCFAKSDVVRNWPEARAVIEATTIEVADNDKFELLRVEETSSSSGIVK